MQFERRRVGQTKLEVTVLGLGGATLGGSFNDVPAEVARATVGRALDAGITYFDTAPYYGFGRSEHFFGDALRERREGTVLSTKVGRLLKPRFTPHESAQWINPMPFDAVFDYSYDGIMRSFEDSLQRLGVNAVDILYVHDIGPMTHGVEGNKPLWAQLESGGYRAIRALRDQGMVSAIGLGVNEWQVLMDAMQIGDWDVFLLAGRYTLLEQTSLDPFLTTCLERGSSVVVGGPFNSGILVGGSTWNYAKAPEDVIARVAKIEAVCNSFNVPLPAAALQFPLTHPAICNVLPGPRSPEELDGILDWWNVSIPTELWTTLADEKLLAPGTPVPGGAASIA
jgi:D-threo-aldose 1-dehydrogenase